MPKFFHVCDSAVARSVCYDPDESTLTVDFAAGEEPANLYRYLAVPQEHFDNIRTAKTRNQAIGNETPGSEGSYIKRHITGNYRDARIPFAWEQLGPDGEVIRRSTKPLITAPQTNGIEPEI
jgi:KTSC domain